VEGFPLVVLLHFFENSVGHLVRGWIGVAIPQLGMVLEIIEGQDTANRIAEGAGAQDLGIVRVVADIVVAQEAAIQEVAALQVFQFVPVVRLGCIQHTLREFIV
jgi:hypothetical protein